MLNISASPLSHGSNVSHCLRNMRTLLLLAAICCLASAAPQGQWYAPPFAVLGNQNVNQQPNPQGFGTKSGTRSQQRCRGPKKRCKGKREAEADPVLVYTSGLAYPYVVPAVLPLSLKPEVVATGAAVPVAVGGYKAVAGDNGDLKVACVMIRVMTSSLTSTFI